MTASATLVMLCVLEMIDTTTDAAREALISTPELQRLQVRANAPGIRRLLAHLTGILAAGSLYALALSRSLPWPIRAAALLAFGFTLVTMFAAMHETVHRTAFKSRWLNDAVGWFAGLLSFYNSSFYRPYHGVHHRFTQIAGKDPELEDKKPTSVASYVLEMSGVPWWVGKLRTYVKLVLGQTQSFHFLNEQSGPLVVRSVRVQMLVYVGAQALSFWLSQPYFLLFWLAPVAAAQPLLRAILLAEHAGCSENSDGLSNTRTTYTLWPVRLLMWEMPYHAEHHLHPALPFFALARAHERIGPRLRHLARGGYLGFHAGFLRALSQGSSQEPAA